MLESVLVGLIVLGAAGYALWALMPVATRRSLAQRAAAALGGPSTPGPAGKVAAWLLRVAKAPGGGCSDCPAATLTPAERAQQQQQQRQQRQK
jgi:hypothetical protein